MPPYYTSKKYYSLQILRAGAAWMAPPGIQQPAGAGVPGGWGASAPALALQAAPAVATRGSEPVLQQGGQQPAPPPLGGGSAP